MNFAHLWTFLAGLGLFLFGMMTLERVLRKLSGRTFKLFLRRHTDNLFKAVTGGALVTALVQSSSVVGFMTLAFVGAGVISFRNALAVILGANLGTTLASWIVVAVGFQLDIESFALPVVAVTALGMFFFQKRHRLSRFLQLFFALGLLFVGLDFMKVSALQLVGGFHLSDYADFGTWFFVLAGFVLTSMIQASSAVVAITLTALSVRSIDFAQAAAIVIGSELGTTVKLILGGAQGSIDKKRVAWGNFFFNLTTLVIAYIFLTPLLAFIRDFVGISDPLFGLVFFQTLINIIAIVIFLPVIGAFSKWLVRRFPASPGSLSMLHEKQLVPSLAIDVLRDESGKTVRQAVVYIRHSLDVHSEEPASAFMNNLRSLAQVSGKRTEEYHDLKHQEGLLLSFAERLREQELDKEELEQVSSLLESVRYAVQAAKSAKDIRHNIKDFRESVNDYLHHWYHSARQDWTAFESGFMLLLENTGDEITGNALGERLRMAYIDRRKGSEETAGALKNGMISSSEASTVLNVERELYITKRSLLNALSLRYHKEKMDQENWEQEH